MGILGALKEPFTAFMLTKVSGFVPTGTTAVKTVHLRIKATLGQPLLSFARIKVVVFGRFEMYRNCWER